MYRDGYHDWRRYPRLLLSAAGLEGECSIAGVPGRLEVLDVSQGGARLTTENGMAALQQGREVLCSFLASGGRVSIVDLAGIVRWRDDGVMGIEFTQPLDLELHELRELFL